MQSLLGTDARAEALGRVHTLQRSLPTETAPGQLHAVEVKSGETVASDFFAGLDFWRAKLPASSVTPWLVHGGTARQHRESATVLPRDDMEPLLEALAGR